MVRLFRVQTVESLYAARDGAAPVQYAGGIRWEWVRVGREKPVAPYPWLIRGYHRLPQEPVQHIVTSMDGTEQHMACGGRAWAEQAVDECFTAAEIAVLKRYLLQYHWLTVVPQRVRLPINGVHYAKGLRRPLLAGVRDREALANIVGGRGYPLPFPVGRLYLDSIAKDAFRHTVTFF